MRPRLNRSNDTILDHINANWSALQKWQRQLLTFAGAIIAFFAAGQLINFLLAPQPKHVSTENRLVAFNLPADEGEPTEQLQNRALRAKCLARVPNNDLRTLGWGITDKWQYVDPKSGLIYLGIIAAADFASCLMTTEVNRFCSNDQRKNLATNLARLIDVQRQAVIDDSTTVGGRKISAADKLRRNQHADGVITGIDGYERLSLKFTQSLENLAESGYFSKSDFGWWSFPNELAPYLVSAKAEPCRP